MDKEITELLLRQVRCTRIRSAEEQIEIQKSIYATPGRGRFGWRLEVDREVYVDATGALGTS